MASESRGNAELIFPCLFSRRAFPGEGGRFGLGICIRPLNATRKKNMAQKLCGKDFF